MEEDSWGNGEVNGLGSLEVDDQLELGGLLHGEVGWFGILQNLVHLDVCFINTLPVLSGFSWERHAPAWLLGPGWSPAFPGEGTGTGLTKWTSSTAGVINLCPRVCPQCASTSRGVAYGHDASIPWGDFRKYQVCDRKFQFFVSIVSSLCLSSLGALIASLQSIISHYNRWRKLIIELALTSCKGAIVEAVTL